MLHPCCIEGVLSLRLPEIGLRAALRTTSAEVLPVCWQAFIPKALNELARVDVINQQADFGREADFKLGNKEEREAKACACSSFLRATCLVFRMSRAQPQPCSVVLGAVMLRRKQCTAGAQRRLLQADEPAAGRARGHAAQDLRLLHRPAGRPCC